jgi:putative (di)nucleoside polyphosphate hydrolase
MSELGAILTADTVPVNAAGFLAKEIEKAKDKRRKK